MRITVLDSSALLTILLPEADAQAYMHQLADAEDARLSAINYTETSMVYASRAESGAAYARVDRLIAEMGIKIEEVLPILRS